MEQEASTMWHAQLTTSDSGLASLVLTLMLQGVGSGMFFVLLLFSVVGPIKDPREISASAYNLVVTLGGSVASASLVTLLDRREDLHLGTLNALVNLTNVPVRNFIGNAHGLTQTLAAAVSDLIRQQAAALAFADIFPLTGVLTLISGPIILGSPKPTTTDMIIEVG